MEAGTYREVEVVRVDARDAGLQDLDLPRDLDQQLAAAEGEVRLLQVETRHVGVELLQHADQQLRLELEPVRHLHQRKGTLVHGDVVRNVRLKAARWHVSTRSSKNKSKSNREERVLALPLLDVEASKLQSTFTQLQHSKPD